MKSPDKQLGREDALSGVYEAKADMLQIFSEERKTIMKMVIGILKNANEVMSPKEFRDKNTQPFYNGQYLDMYTQRKYLIEQGGDEEAEEVKEKMLVMIKDFT